MRLLGPGARHFAQRAKTKGQEAQARRDRRDRRDFFAQLSSDGRTQRQDAAQRCAVVYAADELLKSSSCIVRPTRGDRDEMRSMKLESIFYDTILYYAILYYIYYTRLYYTMLYYIVVYYTMLYYIILYSTLLDQTRLDYTILC